MDHFFARGHKSLVPTKRKAMANSDEEFFLDAAQQSSQPPHKKTTATSARKPHQPNAPKTRKPVTKTKELPSLENATLSKPEAWGQPEVWAQKRQQLCSSLPYHRGYESAAYRTNGIITGFLANQGIGPRDVFTEDIYITGVGGGKEKGEGGETKQVKDQNVSSIAISFQRTMEAKLPVAIIAGQRNPICPVKLTHHFNVLDFFHITDVWYVFGVEERCKQVIVCPKCHGCIRRLEWRQWTCETAGCDFTHTITQIPVPLSKVLLATDFIADKSPLDFAHESVGVNQKPIAHYDVYGLKIPGETIPAGWIQIFRSNGLVNSQPGGPNDLYLGMQKDEYKLRRGPARHPGLPMEIVTAHFTSNCGAPYKCLIAHEANSFEDAPAPILKAMQRMTWAGKQAFVGKDNAEFTPFNEILCLGYFENMHIGYHDDGEDTLGETVATLSLGASSTMCFRPKNKSTIGGILKANKGSKASKKDYVKVTLNHGDIIIIHGSGIHKYYEVNSIQNHTTYDINQSSKHAVTPYRLLRFALTCRYVKPELPSPEDRILCAQKSALPANFADHAYDGDIDVKETANRLITEDDDEFTKLKKWIIAKKLAGELNTAECAELREILLRK
ncbi:hypothetical protein sscle_07g060090 [Sclerotinia sclerotiorum 1980 UF-70]|uniref:Fe2OG dioxygenase domain-containing protein n=1 Tax=Sclerotinia sclerotiorum (strain ATCC 18683 / 1980 / Ss-1) TaxID=665079 RepID=A0A1D9Q8M9_SCLS1|nr:hypothetical protein sscle_07g060090 [Sclerotinia sclerotiorum 1980 UF-70]